VAARSDKREGSAPPPAPRGSTPDPQSRPWWRPSPRWITLFLILLAANIFFTARATEPASRVRVPYSPFFLNQVKAEHVDQITSKGTAIQGMF
jgi:cell division protease FtsH